MGNAPSGKKEKGDKSKRAKSADVARSTSASVSASSAPVPSSAMLSHSTMPGGGGAFTPINEDPRDPPSSTSFSFSLPSTSNATSSSIASPSLALPTHPTHASSSSSDLGSSAGLIISNSSCFDFVPSASDLAVAPMTQDAALGVWSIHKTFRPQRVVPEDARGAKGLQMMRTVQATMKATLNAGDLEKAVKCPPEYDVSEWLALNTVMFFNASSLIYGTVREFCTAESCPYMTAGKAEYLWRDDTPQYRNPTRLAAPAYIDLAMTEVDAQITDPDIFPTEESKINIGKKRRKRREKQDNENSAYEI